MMQNPETRHRKEDIVHPLRQITTNPMKKGGYGFNKTTLSERKGYKGVVSITCVPGWTIDSVHGRGGEGRGGEGRVQCMVWGVWGRVAKSWAGVSGRVHAPLTLYPCQTA